MWLYELRMKQNYRYYHLLAEEQGWDIEMYRDRGWFKSLYIREPGDNQLNWQHRLPASPRWTNMTLGNSLGLPPRFWILRPTIMDYYAKQNVDFSDDGDLSWDADE